MSSPIIPIEGLSDVPILTLPADVSAERIGVLAPALAEGETMLALIARTDGPPPELLEQIAAAAMIEEQLREGGRQLRFLATEDGLTRIEIHDRDGNLLGTLSTAQALEVAAGKPLD